MTARFLPAIFLSIIITTFSSNISSSTKVKVKMVKSEDPVKQPVEPKLTDSIEYLLKIVDSVAIATKCNTDKININNKIIKNHEIQRDSAKNP
jgi:hypothetical protein